MPNTAWAVSLNVTSVAPAGTGYVTLYSAGTPVPLASSLNFRTGGTRANSAVTPLNELGQVSVLTTHALHLILDVNGYYQ